MAEVMAVIPIDIPFPRSIVERRLQILLRIEPISRPDVHHHLEASLSPFLQNNIQDATRTGRIVLCRRVRHDFDLLDIRRRRRFKQIHDFCLLHIRWFAIQQDQDATPSVQTDGLALFLDGNSRQLL